MNILTNLLALVESHGFTKTFNALQNLYDTGHICLYDATFYCKEINILKINTFGKNTSIYRIR